MDISINYEEAAPVFNIQTYCIHDGPGIRSTVFVKGCPLRCLWCANPESQAAHPELMTYSSKCTGCGQCVSSCPKGAISIGPFDGRYIAVTDRSLCVNCGACSAFCPRQARELAGHMTTVRGAMDKIRQGKLFYDSSGGGMTISGGEALSHPEFSANLFAAAHAEGISTAIESCVFASRHVIDLVFPHVDTALLDVKHMDSAVHKKLVGVGNEAILDNIRYIHDRFPAKITIRVPTIPGYNDSPENMHATARFAASLGLDTQVHLLPFHNLGESKSDSLGRPASLGIAPPTDEHMEELKAIVESCGLYTQIGG